MNVPMKDVRVEELDVPIVSKNEKESSKKRMKNSKTVVDKSVVKKATVTQKGIKSKTLFRRDNKKTVIDGNVKKTIKGGKKGKN